MQTYRLSDDAGGGWPFLSNGHAFLADGTPLTERDEDGRIVPAADALCRLEKDCSGGNLRLSDRWTGMEALARALNKKDYAHAPILLLQLQIDEVPDLTKFNQFHKPPGPGGGQFASGPSASGPIEPAAQSMHVQLNSTYQYGIHGADMDAAHDKVMDAVRTAILDVGSLNFRPGMPGYGQLLHKAIALEILKLNDPTLVPNPVYLDGDLSKSGTIPKGASVPDVIYAPADVPKIIFEFKTGRAIDTTDPGNIEQRERTLNNVPGAPLYEYIQIYGD